MAWLPSFFFFFNDPATTEIYPLSLHDALPIWAGTRGAQPDAVHDGLRVGPERRAVGGRRRTAPAPRFDEADRKSTRLNSSHSQISYAVFCLKKKKQRQQIASCAQEHALVTRYA